MCGWTPAAPTPWRRPQKHPTAERKASDHRFLESTYFQGDKACLLLGSVWVNFDCLAGLELLQACKAVTCLTCTLVNRCTGKDMYACTETRQPLVIQNLRTSVRSCAGTLSVARISPLQPLLFSSVIYLLTYSTLHITQTVTGSDFSSSFFFQVYIYFLIREGGRKKLETSGRGWPASALIWMRTALQLFS